MDVTEQQILALVRKFYKVARSDRRLGPLFNAVITHWDSHIQTMADYWSHVLLGTTRYTADPFPFHQHLPIELEDFDHWLALFEGVADATLPAEAAREVKAHADQMAESFRCELFPFVGSNGRPSRTPPARAALGKHGR